MSRTLDTLVDAQHGTFDGYRAARALMGEARMDSFRAWDLAGDIVAALRTAGGVR